MLWVPERSLCECGNRGLGEVGKQRNTAAKCGSNGPRVHAHPGFKVNCVQPQSLNDADSIRNRFETLEGTSIM